MATALSGHAKCQSSMPTPSRGHGTPRWQPCAMVDQFAAVSELRPDRHANLPAHRVLVDAQLRALDRRHVHRPREIDRREPARRGLDGQFAVEVHRVVVGVFGPHLDRHPKHRHWLAAFDQRRQPIERQLEPMHVRQLGRAEAQQRLRHVARHEHALADAQLAPARITASGFGWPIASSDSATSVYSSSGGMTPSRSVTVSSSPSRLMRYDLPSIGSGVSSCVGWSGDCRWLTSNVAFAFTARPSATSSTSIVRCCCRRMSELLSCATWPDCTILVVIARCTPRR